MIMFFFFNDTATTEIYTLSLHDALPISIKRVMRCGHLGWPASWIASDRLAASLSAKLTATFGCGCRFEIAKIKFSYCVTMISYRMAEE